MEARSAELLPRLNERDRRLALGAEANAWGHEVLKRCIGRLGLHGRRSVAGSVSCRRGARNRQGGYAQKVVAARKLKWPILKRSDGNSTKPPRLRTPRPMQPTPVTGAQHKRPAAIH